ncbi:hypothetical protein GWI33_000280 [Rhynchophorus ferrugineus]|uniref:Apoptosis inhibitor 5 n=1 Tax=Rhynchophorus ferrugineus TaxID=354439 RepID=A0A834IM17_RHYFE|nr:hypothetical protein GWI33_000280 [Rhynchophorus ferrugineus]
MTDHLQELYEKYDFLSSAKDNITQHSNVYVECIEGTKGAPKEKKLAAQIIAKFFKNFPELQDTSLNAILDLCEDGDSDIRICAMKTLPILCKDNKEYVTNIASVLSQLLQLEDQDYTTACNALNQVFKENQLSATKGILSNIHQPADEVSREKCITYLYKKLTKVQGKLPSDLEDLLIEEGKKILMGTNSNEFIVIISFLLESKLAKTTAGQQELIDLVAERVELGENFIISEDVNNNNVDKLILCINSILPLFSASLESTKFLLYYCNKILPQWESIGRIPDGEKLQLKLLRQLAELSVHCGNVENITEIVEKIFNKLKECMPLPPDDVDINQVPDLDFSSVECLLYIFHKLARKCPEFLTGDQQLLKDFRSRLQYFSRGVQGCKRALDNSANIKKELTAEEQSKLAIAPAVLDNINSLVKDLFYQPPLYKCNPQLSFKIENKQKAVEKSPAGVKRHIPITFDSSNGTPMENLVVILVGQIHAADGTEAWVAAEHPEVTGEETGTGGINLEWVFLHRFP